MPLPFLVFPPPLLFSLLLFSPHFLQKSSSSYYSLLLPHLIFLLFPRLSSSSLLFLPLSSSYSIIFIIIPHSLIISFIILIFVSPPHSPIFYCRIISFSWPQDEFCAVLVENRDYYIDEQLEQHRFTKLL